jgi:hypothetical protein
MERVINRGAAVGIELRGRARVAFQICSQANKPFLFVGKSTDTPIKYG